MTFPQALLGDKTPCKAQSCHRTVSCRFSECSSTLRALRISQAVPDVRPLPPFLVNSVHPSELNTGPPPPLDILDPSSSPRV